MGISAKLLVSVERPEEPIRTMKRLFLSALALSLASVSAHANDFPTQARVEYVLRCMDANGGQSYDTLYPCICSIDKIAEAFTYDEFVQAEMFAMLRSTPGERGGLFRDPEGAKSLAERFVAVTEAAEASCFVGKKK